MALLELDGVRVSYGDRTALAGVSLQVAAHETVCVLGPSGSGKSTLLRAVAGLVPVTAGQVRLDGRDQARVPAHRRGVGLMFQDHQLFPQRDVGGNIAFGLRMRRTPRAETERRVAELLDLVGLPGAQRRAVTALSGGEQQRVALARALAPGPRLLSRSASWTGRCGSGWWWSCGSCSSGWARRCWPLPTTRARRSRWPTASS